MDVQEIAGHLRNSSPLAQLAEADILKLAGQCRIVDVHPGDVVVRESEKGDELFVILRGQFSVFVRQPGLDLEREIGRLKDGQIFGEVALLAEGVERTASVRATTEGTLAALSRPSFLDVLVRSPDMAMKICQVLGRYLAAAHEGAAAIRLKRLGDYPDAVRYRKVLPERIATFCRAVVVDKNEQRVVVAMVDPHDAATRQFLMQVLHPLRTDFVGITPGDFTRALGMTYSDEEASAPVVEAGQMSFSGPSSSMSAFGDSVADELLSGIFEKALRLGATDIHLEPRRKKTIVRFRIDGNLVDAADPMSSEDWLRVMARLKIMAELNVTERRMPQDGSFVLHHGESHWTDVRLSCLPCSQGEKAAMRLLPGEGGLYKNLVTLASHKPLAMLMRDLFLQPSGLLLVTGPTGSGKTTTVYAGLHEIYQEASVRNIMTIEDPVDHYLDFATQSQVSESVGRTFPVILRSVLRQDPDVIVVGEVRDKESARITIEASTTGHFVVTSLHTHFALDALTRLQVLGVEPYLLASCLVGVISQRLVARNCLLCSKPVEDPERDDDMRELVRIGVLLPEDLKQGAIKVGTGCDVCRQQGVRGRVGLFEVLAINPELRAALASEHSREDLAKSLVPECFVSMQAYARHLLTSGVISPRHAFRAFPTSPELLGYGDGRAQ